MPALQDVVVALVALAAGLVIARRRFGLGVRTRPLDGCEKCASGDPCAPGESTARPATTHRLKLVRPTRH